MDCDTYHELIVADLDDTLSPSERETVRAHLEDCTICRNARALEAEFLAHLRRVPRLVETPTAVQERLRVALRREAMAAPPSARPRILAIAAAFCVLAALAAGLWSSPGVDYIGSVTDDYRLAAASRLPLDVTTGDPNALARYFHTSRRFTFPPPVSDLRAFGYRLVGGAIRERRGVVFAVIVYERDGEIVVCHRFHDVEGRTRLDIALRRYERAGDVGTWITRRAGVVSCLTGRLPPEELERLVGMIA
ncbi:MAG TPA: zf-HC2 domain-containing protein [Candidatus Binatia bacterium]|jgi:anti-sigma factor RsiW